MTQTQTENALLTQIRCYIAEMQSEYNDGILKDWYRQLLTQVRDELEVALRGRQAG